MFLIPNSRPSSTSAFRSHNPKTKKNLQNFPCHSPSQWNSSKLPFHVSIYILFNQITLPRISILCIQISTPHALKTLSSPNNAWGHTLLNTYLSNRTDTTNEPLRNGVKVFVLKTNKCFRTLTWLQKSASHMYMLFAARFATHLRCFSDYNIVFIPVFGTLHSSTTS